MSKYTDTEISIEWNELGENKIEFTKIHSLKVEKLEARIKVLTEALEDLHPTLNARTQIERVNKALNDTGYRPDEK
jgi:hypothetical protein